MSNYLFRSIAIKNRHMLTLQTTKARLAQDEIYPYSAPPKEFRISPLLTQGCRLLARRFMSGLRGDNSDFKI
jgi:hypothetical protein